MRRSVTWLSVLSVALAGGSAFGLGAQTEIPDLTPGVVQKILETELPQERAQALAEKVRVWFGKANLARGAQPKREGLTVAWAIEVPKPLLTPRIRSEEGGFMLRLKRLGATDVYAGAITLPPGSAMRWHYEVDGSRMTRGQLEVYEADPDTKEQAGVPKGTLTQQPKWQSRIFEGTEREWWVYVPAQYKPENPACVMVFQDGGSAKNYVPTTFDNLIAKGQIPVTVAIFLDPGTLSGGRSNRSFEYDTLSDQYARFLLEEILPEVEKTVRLRHDSASRAIGGISSGGICAFTVAWERPDQFSKVLSWVGSFTNIASGTTKREGGHNYPALLRKTPRKPIRVFLQDGSNDLDNAHGNWPLANQQMASSLKFMGYDYQFVYGKGFHSDAHGRAILPDSLRWLWRDYKP